MPQHFELGVVEKHLRFAAVQPATRLGLPACLVHQVGVDPMPGTQPLAQGGLVGPACQAHQLQQHGVLAEPLGLGEGDTAAGEREADLGDVGSGSETGTGALACGAREGSSWRRCQRLKRRQRASTSTRPPWALAWSELVNSRWSLGLRLVNSGLGAVSSHR